MGDFIGWEDLKEDFLKGCAGTDVISCSDLQCTRMVPKSEHWFFTVYRYCGWHTSHMACAWYLHSTLSATRHSNTSCSFSIIPCHNSFNLLIYILITGVPFNSVWLSLWQINVHWLVLMMSIIVLTSTCPYSFWCEHSLEGVLIQICDWSVHANIYGYYVHKCLVLTLVTRCMLCLGDKWTCFVLVTLDTVSVVACCLSTVAQN